MNDELKELDQLTDAALSEVFAVEVAGWKRGQNVEGKPALWPKDCAVYTKRRKTEWPYGILCPPFATSLDAVLLHLPERVEILRRPDWRGGAWCVVIRDRSWIVLSEGESGSLSRAACIAMIRAKRLEKEGAS